MQCNTFNNFFYDGKKQFFILKKGWKKMDENIKKTKEEYEELMKIKQEYEKILLEKKKQELDAIEKDKLEKIKKDIIESLHGKKLVFATPPADPEEDVEYKSFGEFLKMVKNDDIRLKTTMSTTGAQGGYTVPVEYANEILGALHNVSSATGKCMQFEMIASTVNFPAWLTDLTVSWGTEGTAGTVTKPTLTQKQLALKTLYAIIPMTRELAEDNIVGLAEILKKSVGEKMGLAIEKQIFEGNSDPFVGIANASGTNSVASSTTTTYSDLVSVINNSGQLERYKTKAEWWLTRGALSVIMGMTDQNGRPLWDIGNSAGGILPTILGKPYNISDQIADTTSSGGTTTIYFGDLNTVILGRKKDAGNEVRVLFSETAVIDDGSGSVSQNAFTEIKQMYRFDIRRAIVVGVPSAWVKLTGVK